MKNNSIVNLIWVSIKIKSKYYFRGEKRHKKEGKRVFYIKINHMIITQKGRVKEVKYPKTLKLSLSPLLLPYAVGRALYPCCPCAFKTLKHFNFFLE